MQVRVEVSGSRLVCAYDGQEAMATSVGRFVAELLERADRLALPDAIPEGTRFIRSRGPAVALVLEERPQVRTVRWLAEDSPAPLGPVAKYRTVSLAFPFVVLVVVFKDGALTGYQQCFYRTEPLQTLGDALLAPNLPNVAAAYRMPCWLCLAQLGTPLGPLAWEDKVREIRGHLWGAGFNRSSELNEGMSYWQTSRDVDPRVASVDAWVETSRKDAFFPLGVRWRPVGQTVDVVLDAMLGRVVPMPRLASATDLASLVALCAPEAPGGKRRRADPDQTGDAT